MGRISILELAAVLSKRYGLNKNDATSFVSKMFDVIQRSLEQDKIVKIKGLGTFKIIDVDARESVNVNTGERVLIEGHNKITFTPDALMKELVNKPFSQFETVVLNEGVDFEDVPENETVEPEPEVGKVTEPQSEPEIESEPEVEQAPEVAHATEESTAMPLVDFVDEEEENIPEWVIEPVVVSEPQPEPEPEVEVEPEPEPEPEVEIVPEPEPEPVPEVEPEQEVIAEPETVIEPEPESVVEPEQVFEPEQVVKYESEADVPFETENSVEEEVPAEEELPTEGEEEEIEYEEEKSSNGKKWLIGILALLLGLVGGYVIGNYFPYAELKKIIEKQEVIKPEEAEVALAIETVDSVEIDSVVAEPVVAEVAQTQPAEEEKSQVAPVVKPVEPAVKPAETAAKPALDKYQQKDVRVRTGAWRIAGTAQVVKVKEGETLAQISRRYLGPDMDCYVEVYNDLTASSPLKAGQEIKIPKLEHKKKKSAQTSN